MAPYVFKTPFQVWCGIDKIDEDSFVIGGYASVEVVDKQGDKVPLETLEEAWKLFTKDLDYAHVHILHSNIPVGKILLEYEDSEGETRKSGVDDKGLYILVKIRNDIKKGKEVWQLIREKQLNGFSIAGEVIASQPISNGKSFQQIDKLELHEISVVDKPANQLCLFSIMKSMANGGFDFINPIIANLPEAFSMRGVAKITIEKSPPVPKPKTGESQDKYIPRCVSFVANEEKQKPKDKRRPQNQVVAMCYSTWRQSKKSDVNPVFYDMELLWSGQDQSVKTLLTEELRKGGVAFAPLDKAPISESNKIKEWGKNNMPDKNDENEPNVPEVLAELGTRLEALEAAAKTAKETKDAEDKIAEEAKKAEEEKEKITSITTSVLESLEKSGLIDKVKLAKISEITKGGATLSEALAKLETDKGEEESEEESEDKENDESSKAADKSDSKDSKKTDEEAEESDAEEEKEAAEGKEDDKDKKKPPPKQEDINKMVYEAVDAKIAEMVGGTTVIKKSVTSISAKPKDLMSVPLSDLHKIPFSKLNKGV